MFSLKMIRKTQKNSKICKKTIQVHQYEYTEERYDRCPMNTIALSTWAQFWMSGSNSELAMVPFDYFFPEELKFSEYLYSGWGVFGLASKSVGTIFRARTSTQRQYCGDIIEHYYRFADNFLSSNNLPSRVGEVENSAQHALPGFFFIFCCNFQTSNCCN